MLCFGNRRATSLCWRTASLQTPYLLNIAGEFATWITSFPPSPTATFAILRKLDHCFASLLGGADIGTKESLPGFENGLRGGMSRTDMVRCRSVVEQMRVVIVEAMSRGGAIDEDEDMTETDAEISTDGGGAANPWDDDDDSLHMDVARVYENTLVKLGEVMDDATTLDAI